MAKTDPRAAISDRDFISLFSQLGAAELARRLGQHPSSVKQRRRNLEKKYRAEIPGREYQNNTKPRPKSFPHRIDLSIANGFVLIGSDAHIWPGDMSPAMRGFIKFAKELKPRAVILNGDMTDFPQISKHDPIGWEAWPTVLQEINAAKDTLHEIAMAAGRARKIWTLGNHDARFEKRLAVVAPEYKELEGMHLKDHFPLWEPCWSAWINDGPDLVEIKHRFKGGEHAPYTNTLRSGNSIVTAHLHSAKVIPFTDRRGTRYGVDDGCLADIDHRAFVNYTEDSVKNWRSGFCILRFKDGRLLQPQLALVHDDKHIDFCGQLISI